MGGLFRAPKPVIVQAPVAAPLPAAATVVPSLDPQQPTAASPAADQAASDARVAAQQRAERGLAGTIATSARGALDGWLPGLARKSLLGE